MVTTTCVDGLMPQMEIVIGWHNFGGEEQCE